MFKSKNLIIAEQLLKEGEVSRNWAVRRQITRLGSIINILVKNHWKFESYKANKVIMRGFYVKTKNGGKDYFYYLIKAPKKIKRM